MDWPSLEEVQHMGSQYLRSPSMRLGGGRTPANIPMSQSHASTLPSGVALDRDPTLVVLRRRLVTIPSYFV